MNGEVECFTGYHTPLAVLALVMLILSAILIALVAVITLPWRGLVVRIYTRC